jgi:hypothetical protein
VALRNPDDQTLVEQIPDMPSSALEDKETRNKVTIGRHSSGPVELKANK